MSFISATEINRKKTCHVNGDLDVEFICGAQRNKADVGGVILQLLTLEQPTLFMSVSELHSTTLPKFFFSQSNREMFISKAFFAIPLCNKHFNVNILHLFENDAFLCFRVLHRSNFVDNVGGT